MSLARPGSRLLRPLLAVCLAAGCSAAAWAAPDDANDPLAWMFDRPILRSEPVTAVANGAAAIPATAQALAERMRERATNMVSTALNFLGVPYRRGGTSEETGFDCSGFTRHIFQTSIGLVLPRRADEQARAAGLIAVAREELAPGDLVFFNTLRATFSHVGIYIGDGKFVHSPKPGSEVRVESMDVAYWKKRFTGARRVADASAATAMTHTLAPVAPAASAPAVY